MEHLLLQLPEQRELPSDGHPVVPMLSRQTTAGPITPERPLLQAAPNLAASAGAAATGARGNQTCF